MEPVPSKLLSMNIYDSLKGSFKLLDKSSKQIIKNLEKTSKTINIPSDVVDETNILIENRRKITFDYSYDDLQVTPKQPGVVSRAAKKAGKKATSVAYSGVAGAQVQANNLTKKYQNSALGKKIIDTTDKGVNWIRNKLGIHQGKKTPPKQPGNNTKP